MAGEELEKKRQRLAELRRAKEARALQQASSSAAQTAASTSLQALLASVGAVGESSKPAEGERGSDKAEQQEESRTADRVAAEDESRPRSRREHNLVISEAIIVDIPGKISEAYDKTTQTEQAAEPQAPEADGERSSDAHKIGTGTERQPHKAQEDIKPAQNDDSVDAGNPEESLPEPLGEEEWRRLAIQDDFQSFFFNTSKILERALGQQDYDIFKDYTADDMSIDSKDTRKSLLKLQTTCYDQQRCQDRPLAALEWSVHHPELLLAAYHDPVASHPSGGTIGGGQSTQKGLVCIWNMRAGQFSRPEYVLQCESTITAAAVHAFSPHCYIGGTQVGQIVIWDVRAQLTPVSRSLLSVQGHSHPIVGVRAVGTQHAHSLLSLSRDGKLCTWNPSKLSEPMDQMPLSIGRTSSAAPEGAAGAWKLDDHTVSAISFWVSNSDVESFMVGSEDGCVYFGSRKSITDRGTSHASTERRREWISGSLAGHSAPVTAVDFHPTADDAKSSLSNLVVSSSMDYSCRIWDRKSGKALLVLDAESSEYIYDVKWSPTQAGVFASVDGSGLLQVWDLCSNLEEPLGDFNVSARHSASVDASVGSQDPVRGLGCVSWSGDGKSLACGDSVGRVHIVGLGSDISEFRTDSSWEQLYNLLASSTEDEKQ